MKPLLLFAVSACSAQSLYMAAIGGVRATDDITNVTIASKHYVVGPAVEIGLPLGFCAEVDALYRREGYQLGFGNFAGSISMGERANSWEFPILAKHRLPLRAVKPFLEVGYAPRVISGTITSDSIVDFTSSGFLPQPVYYHSVEKTSWPVTQGLVIGGGIGFHVGRLCLSPSLRYTHWNKPAISGYFGDGPSWQSTQEQADVLVSIGWRIR
jgi:hypothetical protein